MPLPNHINPYLPTPQPPPPPRFEAPHVDLVPLTVVADDELDLAPAQDVPEPALAVLLALGAAALARRRR